MKDLALAFLSLVVGSASAVLLPSADVFYKSPGNLSAYKPGDVIRSRPVDGNLNGIAGGTLVPLSVKDAYQYLYRTTDSLGNAAAAVTTLLVPYGADSSKLLAYQTAYDTANNDCSPSYALRAGANTTAASDIVFLAAALDNGWYVTTSDYEGLNAAYVAGVGSGYATLDSVRATFNEASNSGLSTQARYAMWGYSGGSLASEWAAELQASYAPELNFAGVALGGLVPNVTSVLQTINGGPFAGLAFSGVFGLSKAYPDYYTYFQNNLIPSKRAEFLNIANGCLSQASSGGAFKNVFDYFKDGRNTLTNPISQRVLAAGGQMGTHGVPRMPLFVYKAIADEISPSKDTDALVTKLCNAGASIEYHKDTLGEHISEAVTGGPSALAWIKERLEGEKVTNKGCKAELVALTSLDIETVEALGGELVGLLQSLLGGGLGFGASG